MKHFWIECGADFPENATEVRCSYGGGRITKSHGRFYGRKDSCHFLEKEEMCGSEKGLFSEEDRGRHF